MSLMIDTEKLNRFQQGSFEVYVDRVKKLISENANLFSKSGKAKVVATFPHHVLVMTEEGEGYRASVKETSDGLRVVTFDEVKELKALSEDDVTSVAIKNAREAVDLLFAGKIEESKDRVENVVNYGRQYGFHAQTMKKFLNESLERLSGKESFFGRYMVENKYRMKKVVFGDVQAPDRIEVSLLESKNIDMIESVALCRKNLDGIGSHIDDLKKSYVGKEVGADKKTMALRVIEEAQDYADIAMKILGDCGDLDDVRGIYEKTADYANSVELIKRYLEIA